MSFTAILRSFHPFFPLFLVRIDAWTWIGFFHEAVVKQKQNKNQYCHFGRSLFRQAKTKRIHKTQIGYIQLLIFAVKMSFYTPSSQCKQISLDQCFVFLNKKKHELDIWFAIYMYVCYLDEHFKINLFNNDSFVFYDTFLDKTAAFNLKRKSYFSI